MLFLNPMSLLEKEKDLRPRETQRKQMELQAEMKHSNEPSNAGIVSSRRDRGGRTSLSEFQEEPILLVS